MPVTQRISVIEIIWPGPPGVIFAGRDKEGQRVVIRYVGDLNEPVVGAAYEVVGEEEVGRNRFGAIYRQLVARSMQRVPATGWLLHTWLTLQPQIGETRAERLLGAFGNEISVVLSDRTRTADIAEALAPDQPRSAITLSARLQARYIRVSASERTIQAASDFCEDLKLLGVPDRSSALALFALLGSTTPLDDLTKHPYAASAMLPWPQADRLARSLEAELGVQVSAEDRAIGACDAIAARATATGATGAPDEEVVQLLHTAGFEADSALRCGVEAGRLVRSGSLLRPPAAAWLEQSVAHHLLRLWRWPSLPGGRYARADLTTEQAAARDHALQESITILHGPAGSGKTRTLNAIAELCIEGGTGVILAALSGKAITQLQRVMGLRAVTLAKLIGTLESAGDGAAIPAPKHLPFINGGSSGEVLLMVDETSMIDLETLHRLLRRLPTGTRVVLAGDPTQLQPIGIGAPFLSLISFGRGVVELSEVVRQSAHSPILAAATDARRGRSPSLPDYRRGAAGISLLDVPRQDVPAGLERVFDDLRAERCRISDILVIGAKNVTCEAFSIAMQASHRNSGKHGARWGAHAEWVGIGHPVVATRNRFDEDIFNGLVGRVVALDPPTVHFEGEPRPRPVSAQVCSELQSAWALTCHRAQGSEARFVIVGLDGSRLTRQWLYTALTRAIERVVLVGPRIEIDRAIANFDFRHTGLASDLVEIAARSGA